MLGLFPATTLITAIAVSYGILVAIILSFIPTSSGAFLSNISVALKGAFAINLFLMFVVYHGWRKIWKFIPALNTLIFPDLNGEWIMTINWHRQDTSGVITAKAFIKQSFIKTSMEVESFGSDSETLLAAPKKDPESGRPILYYLFRVEPKTVKGKTKQPYKGAAILKLDHQDFSNLKGNYFTDDNSHGHYELIKKSPCS